jgi:ESCRT-II complex subunit VPS22
MEFARMCSAIGVDPLASSAGKKGDTGASGSLWSQLLGGSVNDFYFELAVRVVEVCGATREENGGLLSFADCCDRIAKNRMEGAAEITEDDISLAIDTLSPLAGGFATIKLGNERYIRSVSKELSTDAAAVLEAAQLLGYISMSLLMTNLHWPHARSKTVVEDLVMDGMLWVDAQSEEMEFWSPSMMGAED